MYPDVDDNYIKNDLKFIKLYHPHPRSQFYCIIILKTILKKIRKREDRPSFIYYSGSWSLAPKEVGV